MKNILADIQELERVAGTTRFNWVSKPRGRPGHSDGYLTGLLELEGEIKSGYLVALVAPLLDDEWAYSVDLYANKKESHGSGKSMAAGVEKSLDSAKSKVEQLFKKLSK